MHDIRRMPPSPSGYKGAAAAAKAHMAARERARVTYREPSEREKLQWTVKQRFQLIPPNARRHTHKPNTLCMVFLPEVGQ